MLERCGERPDGRALLVGPEQAAERRRDAAHGGIHERERLAREALQILEPLAPRRPPPANATCAIVGAIAVLSFAATSHTRGLGSARDAGGSGSRCATAAASCFAASCSIICVSRAYSGDAGVSAGSRRSAGAGTAARFFSASAAIIASMTRSETPPLFSATSARGDKSNCDEIRADDGDDRRVAELGADHCPNVVIARWRPTSLPRLKSWRPTVAPSSAAGAARFRARAAPAALRRGELGFGRGSSTARGSGTGSSSSDVVAAVLAGRRDSLASFGQRVGLRRDARRARRKARRQP